MTSAPWQSPVLRIQRAAGNQAVLRLIDAHRIQTKLEVSQPGDEYEQEAERVAAAVMGAAQNEGHGANPAGKATQPPAQPPTISRMSTGGASSQSKSGCACGGHSGGAPCAECSKKNSLQRSADSGAATGPPAPVVHDVLRSPGQPLDAGTRALMEPRFGRDFSRVRIHTDTRAAESARAVSAKAYTVGPHVVFGKGYYSPQGAAGQRLLAHELTHVVQQESVGGGPGVMQRAEVDDRSCAGLTDIEADINTKVNTEIAAARVAAGKPVAVPAFLRDVMTRLGSGAISPIEKFIEGLPASKRIIPPASLAGTKYAGVKAVNRFYLLHTHGVAHVVGSAAKIHGLCVGADKLGHFFQEGHLYFRTATASGGAVAAAQSLGRAAEIGIQGLAVTGVYSNADQAANLAGMHFYQDLAATPSMTFNISSYITSTWNEQTNPSFYESSVGGVVWNNLLNGTWQGSFTRAGGISAPIDSRVNLAAVGSSVTGTYEYPAASPTNHGTIPSGTITQTTTSVTGTVPGDPAVSATPVSGITINFDWAEGLLTGKGTWTSVNEHTLNGTWGSGKSTTSGGTWRINKV